MRLSNSRKGADYLLNAKDNQPVLKKDIEDYARDENLRKSMDTFKTTKKNGGRIEVRSGFVTHDIDWFAGKDEWENISCIGAINRQCEYKGKTTDEWHYYIYSRKLTAQELLKKSCPFGMVCRVDALAFRCSFWRGLLPR